MLSLPTDVRALLHPPPVHFEPLAERAARGPAAVGGVQGVAATLCRYVYSSHNRLSFVTVLIVLLQGEGFMRWYLSPYRHPPPRSPCNLRDSRASGVRKDTRTALRLLILYHYCLRLHLARCSG